MQQNLPLTPKKKQTSEYPDLTLRNIQKWVQCTEDCFHGASERRQEVFSDRSGLWSPGSGAFGSLGLANKETG